MNGQIVWDIDNDKPYRVGGGNSTFAWGNIPKNSTHIIILDESKVTVVDKYGHYKNGEIWTGGIRIFGYGFENVKEMEELYEVVINGEKGDDWEYQATKEEVDRYNQLLTEKEKREFEITEKLWRKGTIGNGVERDKKRREEIDKIIEKVKNDKNHVHEWEPYSQTEEYNFDPTPIVLTHHTVKGLLFEKDNGNIRMKMVCKIEGCPAHAVQLFAVSETVIIKEDGFNYTEWRSLLSSI